MSDTTAVHGSSTHRRVVIVSLALVAVIVIAVGAIVALRHSQPGQPVWALQKGQAEGDFGSTVSVQFVSDLRAERWHEANQSPSRRFRQQMDEASLKRFVKESPPINGTNTPIKFNVVLVSGGASVTFGEAEPAPKSGVLLLLIGEEGTLKVDRLASGDKAVP
jgi:hypothetical protein